MKVTVRVDGAADLARLMREAPADVRKDMRRTGKEQVSDPLAARARQEAPGRQARAAAATTRGVAGNLPAIRVGGKRRVASGGATAGDLAPGTVFGSRRFGQFPARRRPSYWFFSTVDRHGPEAIREWRGVFDTVSRRWRRGR